MKKIKKKNSSNFNMLDNEEFKKFMTNGQDVINKINNKFEEIPEEELFKELDKLFIYINKLKNGKDKKNNNIGNTIILKYTIKRLMKVKKEKKESFEYNIINNFEHCKKIFIKYSTKKEFKNDVASLRDFYRSVSYLLFGGITVYKPCWIINNLIDYKNIKSLLDPTAGWGGRLLGCWALGIDYTGIDLNKNLKEGYDKMIKLLKKYDKLNKRKTPKIKMIYKDFNKVDFKKINYDITYTCPPFINKEIYEYSKIYKDKKDFYETILNPIYNKINKPLILQIPEIMAEEWTKEYNGPKIHKKINYNMNSGNNKYIKTINFYIYNPKNSI